MAVGRNEPCPCGSGRKFKKCCLGKPAAAEREAEGGESAELQPDREPEAAETISGRRKPGATQMAPRDPKLDALDALWEQFEGGDHEARIALFTEALDGEVLDDELAFEMLMLIHPGSVERDERDRFDVLTGALRERRPELYKTHAHYYQEILIRDAVVAGRLDTVQAMATELAEIAGDDPDLVSGVLDLLAYHGHLATVMEMMRVAWPRIKESDKVMGWAVGAFADMGVACEVFAYLAGASSPHAEDPELKERLTPLYEVDREVIGEYVRILAGGQTRQWALSDFRVEKAEPRDADMYGEKERGFRLSDEGGVNLSRLLTEFIRYLHVEEGVPYTKAEMGRVEIERYIHHCVCGVLEPRGSLFGEMTRPRKRTPRPRRPAHVLCPDRATLDHYLADLLQFINPLHYRAAAAFELVPSWLRFLESRQLLDGKERERTLRSLRELRSTLAKIFDSACNDPAVRAAMAAWPGPVDGGSVD